MSFVSSGTKAQASGDEENDDDDDSDKGRGLDGMNAQSMEAEDEDIDEDDDETSGVGLGFSASVSQGLGFTPPTQRQLFAKTTKTTRNASVKTTFDNSNPLGRGFVPSSANEPSTPGPGRRHPRETSNHTSQCFLRPLRKEWQKQSQFEVVRRADDGEDGLRGGRRSWDGGQGRNVIIEANLRPQKIGLGAVKEKNAQERQEEKRQARLRGEVVVDSDEEEKKKKAARRRRAMGSGVGSGAPSSGASTPKRAKPKYMTMDEVKKAAPGLNIPDAFTPILDLTGPGKKMLTSSSGLMTPTGGTTAENPEQVESRKLARRAQNDFMAILEEWQSLQNRKAYTELQMQQERQELEELQGGLQGHRSMTDAFAELSLLDSTSSWEQRWDQDHCAAQGRRSDDPRRVLCYDERRGWCNHRSCPASPYSSKDCKIGTLWRIRMLDLPPI